MESEDYFLYSFKKHISAKFEKLSYKKSHQFLHSMLKDHLKILKDKSFAENASIYLALACECRMPANVGLCVGFELAEV